MKHLFFTTLLLLAACSDSSNVSNFDYGTLTLKPPAASQFDSLSFRPVLDSVGNAGGSFSNTWYSMDPSSARAGSFLVMMITVVRGQLDTLQFIHRPEFSQAANEVAYLCFGGIDATCPNTNLVINSAERSIQFNDFILPLHNNNTGQDMPTDYTLSGTLFY